MLNAALKKDNAHADLNPKDSAILAYAEKLTRTPTDMTAEDVEQLRELGFNDRAIHDICQITCYFNFVNRMADGLGVELEGQPTE